MGLDMYMYRIKRLSDEEIAHINETRGSGIYRRWAFVDKEEFDSNPEFREDLIPFLREAKIIRMLFDEERLFKDYNVEPDDEIAFSYGGCNGFGWTFMSGKQITISEEEYSNYSYEALTDVYVFDREEVAYWRKYDELLEFITNARIVARSKEMMDRGIAPTPKDYESWLTKNCGYYLLSKEEKAAIKEFLLSENLDSRSDEDYCDEAFWENDDDIFFEAWW